MAGLQRSAISFRRMGSSGLVWDDRFFSGQLSKPYPNPNNLNNPTTIKSDKLRFYSGELIRGSRKLRGLDVSDKDVSTLDQRSFELKPIKTRKSKDGDENRRTVEVEERLEEPPSPKVSGCGCCVGIGKKTSKPIPKSKAKAKREVRSEMVIGAGEGGDVAGTDVK